MGDEPSEGDEFTGGTSADESHDALPGTPITDIEHTGDSIVNWEFADPVPIEEMDKIIGKHVRVFYEPVGSREGFRFVVVRLTTIMGSRDRDVAYTDDRTRVKLLLTGAAYHDGIRHTSFGDDGYLHGNNFAELREAFAVIEDLEEDHCVHNSFTPSSEQNPHRQNNTNQLN